jgi:hypothetical protein
MDVGRNKMMEENGAKGREKNREFQAAREQI